MSDKVLVVIPYLQKESQGHELQLAVTGWEKHFKEDFHLLVVGDWHPVVDMYDNVAFLSCPRIKYEGRGNYKPHIDHVHKFRKVRECFPDSKGFIYACDDMYAVKDFTLEDVKKPKARCREIVGDLHTKNRWVRDNYKTKKLLIKEGLPTMNWVCHLPVWYEWDKLIEIYDKYHCDTRSYVVENLYFNTYYADSDYVVIEGEEDNNYQYKHWHKNSSIDALKEGIASKIWVSNSVNGYSPKIEEELMKHYNSI